MLSHNFSKTPSAALSEESLIMDPSKPYVPTGLTIAQKTRKRPYEMCCLRKYSEEDDNQFLASRTKRQNHIEGLKHTLRCIKNLKLPSSLPANVLVAPRQRGFNWVVDTWHAPKTYHPKDMQFKAPWMFSLRFMTINFEDELEEGNIKAWRDFPVSTFLTRDAVKSDKTFFCVPSRKYGRRIIFSEVSRSEKYLTGRWLVVAYVWCNSKDRLCKFDWMSHISVDTLYGYEARERIAADSPTPLWHLFHEVKRTTRGLRRDPVLIERWTGDKTYFMCCLVDEAIESLVASTSPATIISEKSRSERCIRKEVVPTVREFRE
jgi:hypothetical protein